MSKTCKDFGEVLVALGQGKIVLDCDGHKVRREGDWLSYQELNGTWKSLLYEEVGFTYPAPIYEEPKTMEIDMWINIYPADYNQDAIFLTRKRADELARPSRIACINIKRTVTEGEGL